MQAPARRVPSPFKRFLRRITAPFRETAEQRYVKSVLGKIGRGAKHSTLGPEVRDPDYTRRKAERWAQHMLGLGLKPDHLCVEYGCGSLWAAEPLIRYLEPGRFYGLDVTDRFYAFGIERLGYLMAAKQVRLGVIDAQSLREVAALQPDFIFSRKVLPHVPEDALPRYIANVTGLMARKTVAVLDNTPKRDGIGRRHTVESLARLLPPGFEIRQERFAAILRRTR